MKRRPEGNLVPIARAGPAKSPRAPLPVGEARGIALVSADEMRRLDRLTIEQYGVPGHVLMERAGAGATRALLDLFPHVRRRGRRVLIVAGKGNNGGDGFVIGRLLRRRNIAVDVVLLARAADVTGDAARMLRAYRKGSAPLREVTATGALGELADRLEGADLVVDAILGTGLNTDVRGLLREAIELINAAGVPVLAVDIPSGLSADTGLPLGTAIQAEATATFAFAKIGHALHPGVQLTGTLAVIDIGIAAQAIAQHPPQTVLLDAGAVAGLVPLRAPDTHKGDCGHVLVIAGSFGKTGAAQLAARAALGVGAGLVTVVGPALLYSIYAGNVLEAMTDVLPDTDGRIRFDEGQLRALVEHKTAVVVGPGIGTHDDARRIVAWLLQHAAVPVVVDADALTCLASDLTLLDGARVPTILTPHPGEMARLLGTDTAAVQADRVGHARQFAVAHRCVLVLKGARTVIAASSGQAWINPTGNPGMASGGMGDVLAGILGGLLAQRLEPSEAARLGVYLHGAAADRVAAASGEIGMIASDLLSELPATLHALGRQPPAVADD